MSWPRFCVFLLLASTLIGASVAGGDSPKRDQLRQPRYDSSSGSSKHLLSAEQAKLLQELKKQTRKLQVADAKKLDELKIQNTFRRLGRLQTDVTGIKQVHMVPRKPAVLIATDRQVRLWGWKFKRATWTAQLPVTLPKELQGIYGPDEVHLTQMVISPTGKFFATVDNVGGVCFFETKTGKVRLKLPPTFAHRRTHLSFCRVTNYVMMVDAFGFVELYDLKKRKTVIKVRPQQTAPKFDGEPPASFVASPAGFPCVIGYTNKLEFRRFDAGSAAKLPAISSSVANIGRTAGHVTTVCLDDRGSSVAALSDAGELFIYHPDAKQGYSHKSSPLSVIPFSRQYSLSVWENQVRAYPGAQSMIIGTQGVPLHITNDADLENVVSVDADWTNMYGVSADDQGNIDVYKLLYPSESRFEAFRKHVMRWREAQEARKEGDYQKLESLMQDLAEHTIVGDGEQDLRHLAIQWLSQPEGEQTWQDVAQVLDDWEQAFPDSKQVQVVRGAYLMAWAWHARGSGFAHSVTEDGMRSFHQRLTQAEQILLQHAKASPDDALVNSFLISVAKGLSRDRNTVNQHFKRGFKADPKCWPMYSAMAEYLLPRWHGNVGDLAEFAVDAAGQFPESEQNAVYARIAGQASLYFPSVLALAELGFDLDRTLDGAERCLIESPQHALMQGLTLKLADLMDDRDAARRAVNLMNIQKPPKHCGAVGKVRNLYEWASQRDASESQLKCVRLSRQTIRDVEYSPDGASLVVACTTVPSVVVLDAETLETKLALPGPATAQAVYGQDGNKLYSTGSDGWVVQWDLKAEQATPLEGAEGWVLAAATANQQNLFVAGNADGKIWLWDPTKPEQPIAKHDMRRMPYKLEFTPDDSRILLMHERGLLVWNYDSDEIERHVKMPKMFSMAKHGKWFVNISDKPRLWQFNDESFETAIQMSSPKHQMHVEWTMPEGAMMDRGPYFHSGALSPKHDRLALGFCRTSELFPFRQEVTRITVWDMQRKPSKLIDLAGHTDMIMDLDFSPDGQRLASVSRDGTLRTWDLSELEATGARWRERSAMRRRLIKLEHAARTSAASVPE